MIRFAATVILTAVVLAGFGQDDETKCAGTTYDMSVCLSRIYEQVDATLKHTYEQAQAAVAKSYTARDQENLREAERAWAAYRDATCKAEYGLWGGGTGGPLAHTMCRIRVTRHRIVELNNTYLSKR